MQRKKQEFWTVRTEKQQKPRPPKFFLTDAEKKDMESLRIQRWLDLADMALDQTGEAECDELFHPAPAKKPA